MCYIIVYIIYNVILLFEFFTLCLEAKVVNPKSSIGRPKLILFLTVFFTVLKFKRPLHYQRTHRCDEELREHHRVKL